MLSSQRASRELSPALTNSIRPRRRTYAPGSKKVLDAYRAIGQILAAYEEPAPPPMAEMTDAHRVYGRLGFLRAPEDDWSPVPGVDLLAFRLRF